MGLNQKINFPNLGTVHPPKEKWKRREREQERWTKIKYYNRENTLHSASLIGLKQEIWTHILQLLCKSGTETLDDAFCVAALYFWAAALSWLTYK